MFLTEVFRVTIQTGRFLSLNRSFHQTDWSTITYYRRLDLGPCYFVWSESPHSGYLVRRERFLRCA